MLKQTMKTGSKICSLKLIVISLIIVWAMPLGAQISEGGMPPSLSFNNFNLKSSIQTYEAVIDFDIDQLLAEDNELDSLGMPPRCAKIISSDLTVENSGKWSTLPDGQHIWNLEIYAPEALAILLHYDEFIIPEGGKLFIYNPDYSKILGAYTYRTNAKKSGFATEFISGDRIILEYVSPEVSSGEIVFPQIKISGIAYGYNHLIVPKGEGLSKIRGESESCMININCPEGDDWQNQKRGVARVVIPQNGYIYFCTGSMINNTLSDFDPLFLSAFHCFENINQSSMDKVIFYFNYEYEGCINLGTDPSCPTMTGAQILVNLDMQGSSDGALLRLNNPIPEHYDVYFNGWDRRNIPATSGVCIHHPAGDVKKISTFTSPPSSTMWPGDGGPGAPDAHWLLYFVETATGHSVTEGGSSGSPLFNQNKLIVGTLTGGNSSCNYKNGSNYYGKLWYHWDKGSEKMVTYLDPYNTREEFVEGVFLDYEYVKANFTTDEKRDEMYASKPIKFTNLSRNANTWEWNFEEGTPAVSTDENPPLVTFNNPGVYTVSLTINKGTETENTKTRTIEIVAKEYYCDEEIISGNGSGTSQYPLGASQRQALSSAIYTPQELGLEKGALIDKISWYAENASSRTRTLLVYLTETEDDVLTATKWSNEIDGATLVYESSNDWVNEAGWVTITFPEPFKYSGKKNLKVLVRIYTSGSSEYSSSNCHYSTAVDKHLRWTSNATIVPTSNGTLNSNRPDIKLSASIPCGAEPPAANFLAGTYTPEEVAEFLADEEILFTDRSTGPVVNWEWLFPGGVPERSVEANPSVKYPEDGTYIVTLNVSNHLGSSSLKDTVFINKRIPVAGFSSSSTGFTTYPDHGQLLPFAGGTVTFTDKSSYAPNQWEWHLEGVTPNTSNNSTFVVNYPQGNNAYAVALTASNEAGSNTITLDDYIKVGGEAKVWNIPYGDEGNTIHQFADGTYLTGTNTTYAILAEKFINQANGTISQIDLLMIVINATGINGRTYTISIYDEKDNKPGSVLASTTFKGYDINLSGYTTVVFPQPVSVLGNFYIEIKGMSSVNTEVAIASSKESIHSTVYVYKSQTWKPIEDYDPEKRKISMNIVPVYMHASGANLVNPGLVDENKVKLYPNPIDNYLNILSQYPVKKVIVQDTQGRSIQIINDLNKEETISTSNWEKGIYIVKILTEKGNCNYKIIKK
ncbi:MAG: PKD domain-containing protein [Dysgonamonadaceae bacterium]|jgi:PKD repeat protein|nr:PKD domain-containing protein [Dysgonamonadaceae bacterium]